MCECVWVGHGSLCLVGAEGEWGFLGERIADYVAIHFSLEEFLAQAPRDDGSFVGPASAILVTFEWAMVQPSLLFDRAHQFLSEGGFLAISIARDVNEELRMRKMFYLRSLAEHHGFRVCDPTCLGFPRRIVAFRKSGASRWRLVPLNVTHTEGCLSLFHKVFGTEMSRELWAWKYGDGRGRAMIACRGKEVVAHYGATTRRISFLGQETQALQICDVMVDPKERGVMTRRGVFFQVASAFLESYFGYENDHLLAYGFPNERAMRVAEKLQLYAEVGRVVEIRWPALPYRPHVATVLRRLWRVREEERSLGDLWSKMKRDLAAGILVMRDSNYLHYRYFEHPCFDYVVLVVANRLGGRLRGLIVLRRERDECKLVDLVAPLREIPLLIDHARRQVTRWGLPVLTAWVSATYAGFFRSPGVYKTGTEIPIPTNVWTEGPRFEELQDRWWFMMGDTDFL